MRHPNVVTIYDVGTQSDQVFLTMDLVDGPTLGDWLRERRRGWREIVATFLAAGRGPAAAHAAGIVHRDFKPGNVIVGRDGVRVLDFGLARAGHDDATVETPRDSRSPDFELTLTGEHLGTPAYMAPEPRADARSDQFSFCVALWEALHGVRPLPPTRHRDGVCPLLPGRLRRRAGAAPARARPGGDGCGPESHNVATILGDIADDLTWVGRDGETRPLYPRAIRVAETGFGPEHPHVGDLLTSYGVNRINRLDFDEGSRAPGAIAGDQRKGRWDPSTRGSQRPRPPSPARGGANAVSPRRACSSSGTCGPRPTSGSRP